MDAVVVGECTRCGRNIRRGEWFHVRVDYLEGDGVRKTVLCSLHDEVDYGQRDHDRPEQADDARDE